MKQTTISFPEIRLEARKAHKLRGYFANLFRERSSLLHNHMEDGSSIYRYPQVQYKVVDHVPMLVGFDEGATLLLSMFREINELEMEGRTYPVSAKNIVSSRIETGVRPTLFTYDFKSPWLALNQKNFPRYANASPKEQKEMLDRLLVSHIISFFKGIDYRENERISTDVSLKAIDVNFKNKKMLGFKGTFTSNVLLPDYIGLGKSVARGFGVVKGVEGKG